MVGKCFKKENVEEITNMSNSFQSRNRNFSLHQKRFDKNDSLFQVFSKNENTIQNFNTTVEAFISSNFSYALGHQQYTYNKQTAQNGNPRDLVYIGKIRDKLYIKNTSNYPLLPAFYSASLEIIRYSVNAFYIENNSYLGCYISHPIAINARLPYSKVLQNSSHSIDLYLAPDYLQFGPIPYKFTTEQPSYRSENEAIDVRFKVKGKGKKKIKGEVAIKQKGEKVYIPFEMEYLVE